MKIKGCELFVKTLKEEGVDTVFGYPGGFAIDLFDALFGAEDINVILPRHEQGLIHAADGYARVTGKTAVCLVTSGPGATNLITGIATANYDCVPIVCFTGQVPTALIGNDAFQEVDIVGITRSICKHSIMVRRREDLGRIIKEAFYIARSGKPGPVVVDLPKDIQLALGEDTYPRDVSIRGYQPAAAPHIGQLKKASAALKKAKRPLFLIGGGVRVAGMEKEFTALAVQLGIPVVTTIMGKGAIPSSHPLYFGNLGMHGSYCANMAVTSCDLLFAIGTRFSDRITSHIPSFAPEASIIHMDIDTAAISKNIRVDIPIVADVRKGIPALAKTCGTYERNEWLEQLLEWKNLHPLSPESKDTESSDSVSPQTIFCHINRLFADSVIVTDVGQHQMWTAQYWQMKPGAKLLTSGGLGGMGYGLPAAMGAAFGLPGQPIICITGDGGVQMNIQELSTAVAHELPLIICIFNNSYLGMVRQWQELFYDKRYQSTCMRRRKSCPARCKGPGKDCPVYTPDFIRLAKSYGAEGIRVTEASQILPAFEKAQKNLNCPTVIEFIIDYEELVLPMVQGGKPLNSMIIDPEAAAAGITTALKSPLTDSRTLNNEPPRKRWLSLYVENEVGVLAKIAGLFSGKAYNMESLTVGPTADETISRITIGLMGDDPTYEQIKKQLNRCPDVIRVLDFTDNPTHQKEILFLRLAPCSVPLRDKVQELLTSCPHKILEDSLENFLVEFCLPEELNSELISSFYKLSTSLEVVRGGAVSISQSLFF